MSTPFFISFQLCRLVSELSTWLKNEYTKHYFVYCPLYYFEDFKIGQRCHRRQLYVSGTGAEGAEKRQDVYGVEWVGSVRGIP